MHDQFKGTGVAIVTPFHESGNIDFGSLEKIIEHVISNGLTTWYPLALRRIGRVIEGWKSGRPGFYYWNGQ